MFQKIPLNSIGHTNVQSPIILSNDRCKKWMPLATCFVLQIHIFHIIPQVVRSLLVTGIHCNWKSASIAFLQNTRNFLFILSDIIHYSLHNSSNLHNAHVRIVPLRAITVLSEYTSIAGQVCKYSYPKCWNITFWGRFPSQRFLSQSECVKPDGHSSMTGGSWPLWLSALHLDTARIPDSVCVGRRRSGHCWNAGLELEQKAMGPTSSLWLMVIHSRNMHVVHPLTGSRYVSSVCMRVRVCGS